MLLMKNWGGCYIYEVFKVIINALLRSCGSKSLLTAGTGGWGKRASD